MMLGLSLYIMFWIVEGWNGLDEFCRLPEFSFMLDDQDEHVQHIGSCPDFCWDKNQRPEVTKRNRWGIAVAPALMDVVGKIHWPEIQDHCHLLPGSGRAARTSYSSRSSRSGAAGHMLGETLLLHWRQHVARKMTSRKKKLQLEPPSCSQLLGNLPGELEWFCLFGDGPQRNKSGQARSLAQCLWARM